MIPTAEPVTTCVPDLELELGLTGLRYRPRSLSLALAVPVFLGLLAGVSLVRLQGRDHRPNLVETKRLAVDILLDPTAPAPVPVGPRHTLSDPAGTGSVDPALLNYVALRQDLPRVASFSPDLSSDLAPRGLPDTVSVPLLAPGLPIAPGGNGMVAGASALGRKPRPALKAGLVEVDEFRAVHEVVPTIRDVNHSFKGSVMVRMRIGADGVPLSVSPLNGPESLWPQIVAAALQWRFHVPDRMKAEAPIRLDLNFRLQYL